MYDNDTHVLHKALLKRQGDDLRILQWILNLSDTIIGGNEIHEFGLTDIPNFGFCGEPNEDLRHLCISCKCFEDERLDGPSWLKRLDLESLPPYLVQEIPVAMTAEYNSTFWGADVLNFHGSLAEHIGGDTGQDSSYRKLACELIDKRNAEARQLNAR